MLKLPFESFTSAIALHFFRGLHACIFSSLLEKGRIMAQLGLPGSFDSRDDEMTSLLKRSSVEVLTGQMH